jgi:hypothetical protein
VVGQPLPGNRNDGKAWEESGAKAAVGKTMTIADGGYPGTGLVMPHRRRAGEELPDWKQTEPLRGPVLTVLQMRGSAVTPAVPDGRRPHATAR